MIKKSFYILTAVVAMLFASCEKYDHAISDIEDRLDKIEGTSLTTIDQQIAAINGSLESLRAVDAELKGYIENLENAAGDLQRQIDDVNTALAALESDFEGQITASEQKVLNELNTVKTALEGQLATINNTIATLQAKDEELDQKIADLKNYVDSEITATEDWATATFSTLEQYEATQTAISQINALIKSTQESITALEEKLGKKIADDIATAVAGVNADIAAKVTEITNGYTTAIANATDAITAAYTDAIKTAITASETSMKEWVNSVLADGYYNKAEIDGKITALQTKVAEGDAALQKEIDALKEALAKAVSDLTAAYEKAIEDAITENNGKISAEIAAAVKTAQDNLQAQIDTINSEIEKIKARLDIIEADINSINQQIAAINGSIKELKDVDAALQQLIDGLQTEAADLQQQIKDNADADAATKQALEAEIANLKTLIAALQAKDAELDQKIADLQTYVDNKLANYATTDWANATFATLTQYAAMQQEIADLKALIEKNNTEIEAAYTAAIKAAIDGLETKMTGWVNKQLEQPLKDIAALQADLNALTNDVATDQELADAVAAQQAALDKAVKELEEQYKAAIEVAINTNNGVITAAIADAVEKAQNALQSQINTITGEITAIKSRLEVLEKNFANRIQSLKYIPQFSDGRIALSFNSRSTELYLRISPASIAGLIDEEHITVLARETDNPSTRALNAEFPLLITELSCDETTGIIHVKFAEDETLGTFSDKFWVGSNEAVVCVRISDGNNDVFSDMVPMISKDFIVDLGLPSGTLWAACNVGSTRSEGYGDYFAWGETSPKTTYTWDSYKWGTENNLTKYNSTDGKTTLEAEDDAATANMGADWSTPTDEQWGELISQCVWTWTTLNGVNGYNIVGSNGNSIFLPAAGNAERYQGTQGQYWSNILANISHTHASMLNFTSRENQIIIGSEQGQVRYRGLSVRAVKKQ